MEDQGIIGRNMQQPDAPTQGEGFDQNQMLADMAQNLGPEFEDAFKRVELAGKKIL
jgi:hypothetical protein